MLPALIAGAAAIGGSILSNNQSSWQADHAMDRQMEASNTAHQREVADLKAAGLNPILSANGSGASGLNGQQGTVSDLGATAQGAINSGVAIRAQNKQFEQADADIGNKNADTKAKNAGVVQTEEQTRNLRTQRTLLENQTAASAQEIKQKAMSNIILQKTLDAQIKKARAEGDYSEINQIMGLINSGANSAGAIMDIGNAFKQGSKLLDSKSMKLPDATFGKPHGK